ncbi:hypothetical protein H112_04393 [Trichophyton rubrum D6]|nr:hypothetical protein H100_04402 [Trichophyton rubrum MR850]EZF41849.1 hypothetical protein H102_04386 [Trichophyton rubrum CBS 100081]EZF52521.1 hypothetical protein H103_04395 [Trichophyton rubrum CBS 288.86]EZF63011.1 hypothetical protein H104_04384 [Trichophyton rubrum CBS 289.86]EZF84433.1 hypothetical protein H110_04388 [Trichophyton rubrum MR1448]EZF95111.1 hypothetical protein H113_04429 [Trichophyton rubrum MR1459]EZG06459.1 hypothetical protein H106_04212 [Trichophyton rubrum CBS 
MAFRITLLCHFVLGAFLFISAADAWSFVWHDTENDAHVETGSGIHSCTKINMDKGKIYSWDPKTSGRYCINLFADDNCADRNGWSCPIWGPRKLGQSYVKSFLVNKEGDELPEPSSSTASDKTTSMTRTNTDGGTSTTRTPTETSSSGSTESSTGTTSTLSSEKTSPTTEVTNTPTTGSTTQTSTETPIETGSNTHRPKHPHGDPPTSGGVIAGAVIASIAGVGGLAFFGYFIFRLRKARAASPPPETSADPFSPRPPKNGFQELDSLPTSPVTGPPYAPPASIPTIMEPEKTGAVGYGNQHPPMAELPDTSQVWEMDASRHKE